MHNVLLIILYQLNGTTVFKGEDMDGPFIQQIHI